MRGNKPNNRVSPPETNSQRVKGHSSRNVKKAKNPVSDHLHAMAFANSFLPNIISVESTGNIIAANHAAGKLLGYPIKGLLSMNFNDLFTSSDGHFKRLIKVRKTAGHVTGDLTVIKKNGGQLPCKITSVIFLGENKIRKVITTLVDQTEGIRRQSAIDLKKQKKVTAETIFALSKSDATLNRLHHLEHKLDEEITAKEVSLSASVIQRRLFRKEWKSETKLKAIQIANAVSDAKQTERSDLGKELHDNVNQLLAASRLFMDLALRNPENRNDNITRSSEYTLIAIEEIRKLAKGLVNDAVKNVGLCIAVDKMTHDLMQVHPIKIKCKMDEALRAHMSEKFELNIFRIVQEQLNNIIKHARASRVQIGLFLKENHIILSVTDNGIGFDIAKNADGIGIINIKSRAEVFAGNADFVSKPGKGCILTVKFPVDLRTENQP